MKVGCMEVNLGRLKSCHLVALNPMMTETTSGHHILLVIKNFLVGDWNFLGQNLRNSITKSMVEINPWSIETLNSFKG
jgi:hypothetical protein